MIKAFLGATALIAVTLSTVTSAVAEEEPELGLGGYYKTFSWAGANEPGSGPGAALHDSNQGARFDLPPISGLQIGLSRDPAPAAEGDDDIAPLRANADGEFRDLLSVSASYIDSFVGLDLAEVMGWRTSFVGTLFIAAATSVPELVVTVSALRMGSVDMAIGNLLGSNCFNMAVLLPLDIVDGRDSLLASGDPSLAVAALFAVALMTLALLDVLNKSERRVWLVEPGPVLMLAVYVTGMITVYATAPS